MGKQLFGTDGIRAVAGEYPLDPATVHAFGVALGKLVARMGGSSEVAIGMDTRESGPWLARQVAGGLREQGVKARGAGLITTPGLAWVTRTMPFDAGVMISASHNPFEDNGLKVFGHSGFKLPDAQEHELEGEILSLVDQGMATSEAEVPIDEGLDSAYVDYLASAIDARLDGLRLVLDCANGAASHLAPALFERLGASVESTACEPDGRNINRNCGSLHLDGLRQRVVASGADLGVAFDGDADRALFVAGSGRIVDGDAVLLIAARHLQERGRLSLDGHQPVVVTTVMANLGLEVALRASGIPMVRTAVGDKYVLEEMVRRGAVLGGEQSGHIIFRDYATTGDGMLTALRVLEIVRASGKTLDELAADLTVFPQLLVNVRVKEKRPLESLPKVQTEMRAAEEAFGDSGRIVVRFSGTEPLARVMVEAADESTVKHFANRIADAIRGELGGV